MPTYTYKCTNVECPKNEAIVEVQHRISDPKPSCPECENKYEVHHTVAPVVSFIGNWHCTNGKY